MAGVSFSEIKGVIFDIDGVLTDGSIILDHQGNEIKSFHVRDGQLIRFMQGMGIVFGTISGRDASAARHRMQALGIDFVMLGQSDKRLGFQRFLEQFSLTPQEVIYIGDDVIDLCLLQQAGVAVCPADASPWVIPHCDVVTVAKGGEGVLRELLDMMIRERSWEPHLSAYFNFNI